MYNFNIKKDMISFKKLPRTAWVSIVSHVKSHWLEGWLNKTKLIMSPQPEQNCIPSVTTLFSYSGSGDQANYTIATLVHFRSVLSAREQLKTDHGSINPRSAVYPKHSKGTKNCWSSPHKELLRRAIFRLLWEDRNGDLWSSEAVSKNEAILGQLYQAHRRGYSVLHR